MLLIVSTPVLIRHLWHLKTIDFLHWCLICAVLFLFNVIIGITSMEQHIFKLLLITEGSTEKVLQFKMPLYSIITKRFAFMNKKVFFEKCRKVKTINNNYNCSILFLKIMFTFK